MTLKKLAPQKKLDLTLTFKDIGSTLTSTAQSEQFWCVDYER